jgi:glycine cleavage system H protein
MHLYNIANIYSGVNEVGTDKTDKTSLSRREFLKDAGIVIGGVALASIALSSACDPAETTIATTENTPPGTQSAETEPGATTSSPAATTASSPAVTTGTVPTSTIPGTTPVATTTTVVTGGKAGNPVNSNLLDIPGCSTKVAADRLYSLDNVWVRNMGNNVVQLGISDPFQALADKVNVCSLLPAGTTLQIAQAFGAIEADKLSLDLISPVSGKIVEVNTSLMALPGPINSDAYGSGWMVNVALSKPSELDSLVSPAYYVYLESGKTGTAPPQR